MDLLCTVNKKHSSTIEIFIRVYYPVGVHSIGTLRTLAAQTTLPVSGISEIVTTQHYPNYNETVYYDYPFSLIYLHFAHFVDNGFNRHSSTSHNAPLKNMNQFGGWARPRFSKIRRQIWTQLMRGTASIMINNLADTYKLWNNANITSAWAVLMDLYQ